MARQGTHRAAATAGSPVSAGGTDGSGGPRIPEGLREEHPAVVAVMERGSSAWPRFLESYTPFILSCIRRFAREYDERMEIYVHVCRRLSADDCRRIRGYRGRGRTRRCKFSTWLAAVVFNLSREWIRTARGRRRMFRAVKEMERLDRLIFRQYFWEHSNAREIASLLHAKHGIEVGAREVIDRIAAIERRLSRDHRWRLVTSLLRSSTPISLDHHPSVVRDESPLELKDRRTDPETRLRKNDATRVLRELIDGLPRDQRLALQLRFGRGMTAKAVARALGIGNYKRVYDLQARALAHLETELGKRGLDLGDFGERPTLEESLR